MKTVHTYCRICLATCGIDVDVDDDGKVAEIRPDRENPYTWRDFCRKGKTAHEIAEHPRRLTSPMRSRLFAGPPISDCTVASIPSMSPSSLSRPYRNPFLASVNARV